MSAQAKPEIVKAIVKGAVLEAVLMVAGLSLFLVGQSIFWLVGACVLGALTMVFFLMQAGAFDSRDV